MMPELHDKFDLEIQNAIEQFNFERLAAVLPDDCVRSVDELRLSAKRALHKAAESLAPNQQNSKVWEYPISATICFIAKDLASFGRNEEVFASIIPDLEPDLT